MIRQAIHVLLIEDNPIEQRLIQKSLAEVDPGSIRLTGADRLADGLELLRREIFDVLLLDLNLPDSMGLDTVRATLAYAPSMPIVAISALDDRETALEAVALGAQDYLVKGEFDPPLLERTLRYAIERQHLRVVLDDRDAKMRQLIARNADGMVVTDEDGKIRFANPAAVLLGKSVDEWSGLPFPAPSLPGAESEVKIERAPGEFLTLALHSSPMEWEGQSARLISFRNSDEHKWQEIQERYAFIVDISQDWMSLINRDHIYTAVNRAHCAALGRSQDETLGKHVAEVWGAESFENSIQPYLERCFAGETVRFLEWLDVPNSGKRYFDIGCYPYRDDTGEVVQVAVVSRDITDREQMMSDLIDSEERFRRLGEATFEGLLITRDGVILDGNEQFAQMVGCSIAELTGRSALDFVAPAYRGLVTEKITTKFEGVYEFSILRADGSTFPAEVNARMMPYRGEVVRVTSVRDIQERKKAEERIKRAEQALKTLSAMNQAITRATDEEELVQEACRIGVEVGGYRLAWVGYVENDDQKGVRIVAWAGHSAGYIEGLRVRWDESAWGLGPTGESIRTGLPTLVQTIESDPRMLPWREAALAQGYRFSISLPLKVGERVFGALAFYSDESQALDVQEIALLEEVASDLAFGIETLRIRAERDRGQEALRQSEAKFHHLFAYAIDAILIIDPATLCLLDVNEQAVIHLGYSREELIGMKIEKIDAPSSNVDFAGLMQKMKESGEIRFEHVHRRKNGSEVPVEISSRTIDYGEGTVYLSFVRDISARKQAEAATARAAARTEALLRTANRLNARLDLQAVLTAVCEESVRALGVNAASLNLYDAHSRSLRFAAAVGLPDDYGARHIPVPLSQIHERTEGNESGLIQISQGDDYSQLINGSLFVDTDIRTLLGVVLRRDGEVIGSLNAISRGVPHSFSQNDKALLEGLAVQAVQAILNARLFQATRRQLDYQETLNRVISGSAGATSAEELFQGTLQQLLELFSMEIAAIWVETHWVGLGLNREVSEELLKVSEPYELEFTRPQRIADTATVDATHPLYPLISAMARRGIRSFIAVPIFTTEHRPGLLGLASSMPRFWSEADILLIEAVGRQVGTTMDRLDLFTRNLAQATQIRRIVEIVPEGLVVLDAKQRIQMANRAAFAFLQDLAGNEIRPLSVLTRLGDLAVAELLTWVEEPVIWHEIQVSPSRRTYEAAIQPLQHEESPGWVLMLRDVTEVRERQRYQQLQERLAAVGELAAGIAHDFNNIMGAIVLFAQMLSQNPSLTSRQKEGVEMIRAQAHHATSLIHQILDFSRRSVMEIGPLDLLPFTKEILRLLERTLPETIHLRLEYEQNRFLINGDPTRLQQVLLNLAVNARDAMPDGGDLTLRFDVVRVSERGRAPLPDMRPGDWVSLAITDTGTGIEPEVIPHLFEPFFTTKEPGKGTGLGLAQVYGIIAQHDGFIQVDSQVGQGTTFRIYLPLHEPIAPAPAVSQLADIPLGGTETILLVEDNAATAQAVLMSLEALGYRVLLAADGVEALSVYQGNSGGIDLVLSDMVMPRLGGLELYKALGELNPQLKMIIMTGYPLADDDKALLEKGLVDWILKPFEIEGLNAKLRRLFGA